MSETETAASSAPADEVVAARLRKQMALRLFAFYGFVTPVIAALVLWVFTLVTTSPRGFLDFERHFGFWLFVMFMEGIPVLLMVALAHFLVRSWSAAAAGAVVFLTGAAGWAAMGAIINTSTMGKAALHGLTILAVAFPLALRICQRSVLPAPTKSVETPP